MLSSPKHQDTSYFRILCFIFHLICVYKCCNHFVNSVWILTESLIWMSRLMIPHTKGHKTSWGEQNSLPAKRGLQEQGKRQAWASVMVRGDGIPARW